MNAVTREMTFFFGGFFGYGEKGDFKAFSLAHILPILLGIAAVLLLWKYGKRIRSWKWEKELRFGLAFLAIFCEFSYYARLMYVGNADLPDATFMGKLPLQVCTWTLFFTAFMAMKESRGLFSVCFFLTMSTGIMPLFFPAVISSTGPGYFRYYQFWGEHLVPIILVFYMIFVHGYKVRPIGMAYALGWLLLLSVPCVLLNQNFTDASYMYLKHGSFAMLDFLPDSLWVMYLIMFSAVLVLFAITWLIYRLVQKHAAKSAETDS